MEKILTLLEVAEYLRISERTVKDWAANGTLPGGKIGGNWRFRKDDILSWVDKHLTKHNHSGILPQKISVSRLVQENRIFHTEFESKNDILNFLIDQAVDLPGIDNRAELADAVYKREELMSTGIGLGIASPHVRLNGVEDVYVYIAVNKCGISDYASLDNKDIRLIMFFVAGRNQHSQYIRALSALSTLVKVPLIYEQILESSEAKEVYSVLCSREQEGQ